MFERLKRGYDKAKSSVQTARAFTRHQSVSEYRAEQEELKKKREKGEKEFRSWKIDEDFEQKKKRYKKRYTKGKKSGGGLFGGGFINNIADIGANVNKNVSRTGGIESFNRAVKSPGFGDTKKRKKRKKKGKVIEIRLK